MDRKSIKERGKSAFRANYWAAVIVALVLTIVMGIAAGGGYSFAGTAGTAGTMNEEEIAQITQEFVDDYNSMSEVLQGYIAAFTIKAIFAMAILSFLVKVFLVNPIQVGCYRFFRKNAIDQTTGAGTIGEGFGNYGHTFVTLLLRDVFLTLWTLLFIIPGFVMSYAYALVPYIIKDNPELSATEAIKRSKELMNGHKMELFVMDLSFLGWLILGAFTCNILNIFWTNPYYNSSKAVFYLDILEQNQ